MTFTKHHCYFHPICKASGVLDSFHTSSSRLFRGWYHDEANTFNIFIFLRVYNDLKSLVCSEIFVKCILYSYLQKEIHFTV